ncbi:type II toxin-antitoxin system RelE/ParE family toxin [Accumulibacter sp.]|uniref:type II toxin-antitoxin system RelE/ParE family toxin n=1 Tax=Accumulibacter sp. TaxID=2053492 RepID=UPI003DA919E7
MSRQRSSAKAGRAQYGSNRSGPGRSAPSMRTLQAAESLDFLRVPPGNRLEALGGDRAGQWSIRINGQWRLCLEWHDGHAWNVEIVDYHQKDRA